MMIEKKKLPLLQHTRPPLKVMHLGQVAGLLEVGGKQAQRGPYQAVVRHVAQLKADKLIQEAGGVFSITPSGRNWVRALTNAGGANDQF